VVRGIGRALVGVGTIAACALTAHTLWNLRHLRALAPEADSDDVAETVSVIVPARNEEEHVAHTVRTILEQQHVPHLHVIVLNDGSTDRTREEIDAVTDDRVQALHEPDAPLPHGWLGKPWACARAADHATGSILVFVDADVELVPTALVSAIRALRSNDMDMVAPYPRQIATTALARLVQPLIPWSWATTVPLAWARKSQWPSMSAANGQFLVIDAEAYRAIGGHRAVATEVLEDIALMRAIRASGFRAETMNGSAVATCTMYRTDGQVVDGYTKSLWNAFGGPAGSVAITAVLLVAYVIAPAAVISKSARRAGLLAYAAGVVGRVAVGRSMNDRVWPDALAHPLSIIAFTALEGASWWRRVHGTASWKGRPVEVAP